MALDNEIIALYPAMRGLSRKYGLQKTAAESASACKG
jgi:hypothetical protein